MKPKSKKPEVTPQAVREAGLKATQARRMADSDQRVARAAKAQLKSAKKTWKLARKAAKRSAKSATRLEEEFRALEKRLRRTRPKSKAELKRTLQSTASRKRPVRRRATTPVAPSNRANEVMIAEPSAAPPTENMTSRP